MFVDSHQSCRSAAPGESTASGDPRFIDYSPVLSWTLDRQSCDALKRGGRRVLGRIVLRAQN
jgi:hypothetical protein